jgi:hypothetical protein
MDPKLCVDCEEDMELYDAKNTDPDRSLDDDGDFWPFWKQEDCAKHAFLYCDGCKLIGVICVPCNERMHLVGHMGFDVDGSEHMRNSKTGVQAQLDNPNAKLDRTKPRFETIDLSKQKLRLTDWQPCGPDGTYHHFWSCAKCGVERSFSAQ